MESARPPMSNRKRQSRDIGEEETKKLFFVQSPSKTGTLEQGSADPTETDASISTKSRPEAVSNSSVDSNETIDRLDTVNMLAIEQTEAEDTPFEAIDTLKVPAHAEIDSLPETPTIPLKSQQRPDMTRGKALLLASLLLIIVLNAVNSGYAQLIGPQGWAIVLGGPANTDDNNPLFWHKLFAGHKDDDQSISCWRCIVVHRE